MLETLVQLFFAFARIGFTSFGGTSMRCPATAG